MRRRAFLQGAGVVTVLVAGGGVWRAMDREVLRTGTGPAFEPWSDWRRDPNAGNLAYVRAAILAASPHNAQPWLFKVTDASIELYLDPRRTSAALDPFRREAFLGLGCALENLILAAKMQGTVLTFTIPRGRLGKEPAGPGPDLAARVDISGCIQEWTDLYEAIPRRHTYRGAFLPEPVPAAFLEALGRLAANETEVRLFLFQAQAQRRLLAAVSRAARDGLRADPAVLRARESWLRLSWDEVQARRDGLTLDTMGLPPLAAAAAKLLPAMLVRPLAAERDGADALAGAPLAGIIAVHDRLDREQCLRAGRFWQRLHLQATVAGLAARPCNEAMAMIDHEQALGRSASFTGKLAGLLGDPAWEPTFLFCMGHAAAAAPASPRRPVAQVLIRG